MSDENNKKLLEILAHCFKEQGEINKSFSERLDKIENENKHLAALIEDIDKLDSFFVELQESFRENIERLDEIEGRINPATDTTLNSSQARWRTPDSMPDAPIERIAVDKKDFEKLNNVWHFINSHYFETSDEALKFHKGIGAKTDSHYQRRAALEDLKYILNKYGI